jgi:DNA topoisomerase-1
LKLVIVESPAKAKTIAKFLGKEYRVEASYGHIRDLPSSAAEIPASIKQKPWARMAVDVDNQFQPHYVVQKESKKRMAELKKLLKDADELVLATDEDREGESISWHLLEELKPKVPVKRIAFHEITKEAIKEAIANPRDVNDQLVRAQESRRILDRLYGYSLSPVLWKKVRTKLSAGRVQSVAVRIVVEREEARKAFNVSEYWDVEAALEAQGKPFKATLTSLDGKRLASGKDFDSTTGALKESSDSVWVQGEKAKALAQQLEQNVPWNVVRVEQKQSTQRPQPPFTTSTLQQAASSLLGFSPSRTMRLAQELYEGIDLGGGDREGLITYMRTDSVVLSDKALGEAGEVIKKRFGADYHKGWRRYTTKSKMAQEAHEAIRPTHLDRHPDDVAHLLPNDELRLYRLIWNRTLSSQMADAELLKSTIDFEAKTDDGAAILRANGSVVTFPGFLRVADVQQRDTELPPVKEGMQAGAGKDISIQKLDALKHETQPPARFTEASLVRALEEEGIGRPSTYAPTIGTIQARGYVIKKGNALAPTFLGIAVTLLLRDHFAEYVDYKFTARMEDALDNIAEGNQDWIKFLGGFYFGDGNGEGQFGHGLKPQIEGELEKIEFPNIPIGIAADGQPIIVRVGKNAPFLQKGEGGATQTASVPEEVLYEDLDMAKAEELLATAAKGQEALGVHPETGEKVYALLGPFGPYVQLGQVVEGEPKPKRASLPRGTSLEQVDLETALEYLSLPREVGRHPETGNKVSAAIGRFGPYIKHGDDFRSLRGDDTVFNVSLERALELLAQPKGGGRTKTKLRDIGEHPETKNKIELFEGRYGPYITDGEANASLPKGADPAAFTLAQAVELLKNAPPKKKGAAKRKPAARKKKTSK